MRPTESLALLRPDPLTALMRATWTWDDRALRRDLADVLVWARAAELLATHEGAPRAWRSWHDDRTQRQGSAFVRNVLGSHLLTRDLPGMEAYAELARVTAPTTESEPQGDVLVQVFMDRPPMATGRPVGDLVSAAEAAYVAAFEGPQGTKRGFADIALARSAALALAGDPSADAVAQALSAGATATLAVAERLGTWDPAMVRTRAQQQDSHVALSGEKRVVPYVEGAQILLVMGRTTAGPTLYRVDPQADGLTVTTSEESGTPVSVLSLHGVTAELVGPEGTGGQTMSRVIEAASVIISGELLGHAERSIEGLADSSPDHSNLPQLLADWAVASVMWEAALTAVQKGTDGGVAAAMCHIAVTRAARSAAIQAPPSPDAIVRRDRVDVLDLVFGGPASSHERLLERMEI